MKFTEPGIYYDMPEEEYHSDWSLSASGLKNLIVSPLCYWINHPMNPSYEPVRTDAMDIGTAWHKYVLEGKDAFDKIYVVELNKDDYPDAITKGDDLSTKCKDMGLPVSGTNLQKAQRIAEVNPSLKSKLFPLIEAEYEKANAGKTQISHKVMKNILYAAEQVESNPALLDKLRGGKPEVSIFWIDEETGLRMKRRVDYWKGNDVIDLKTFANQKGRNPFEESARSVTFMNYSVDVHSTLEAVGYENTFYFLFMEKGSVPHVVFKKFCHMSSTGAENMYFDITRTRYREAVHYYKKCLDKWGYTQKWCDPIVAGEFIDEDFPLGMFNG